VHPVVFAWKNDVQSATDFIIQHSTPLRDFTPEWFSDLKREGELTKRALEIIAVSTLLDLELPEHIAHGMCEIDSGTLLERPIVLTSYSRRIGYEKTAGHSQSDRWPGYVLTSPYYASSLLRRLEKLDEDFVKDTIVEMVGRSLARAEQQINLWKRTDAEFLRHLFQRLGKRKVNRLAGFSDGTKIAGELFERYGPSILQTLQRDKSSVTFANWAGTFSYILVPRKVRQFNTESKTTEQMVYELCSFALKESPIVDDPQVFVTLLLAIRAVCEPYSGDPGVKDLADAARITLDLNRVLDSIESIGDSEAERRSNQAVLSYAKFLRIIPDWSMYERCHEVTRVYDRVAKRFQASNFRFDALNSVERANVVWIRTGDGVAISQRAQYLREARNVAGQRHQVRHKSEVERAIAKFQKDYGRDIDDLA
jgi:hypothetical protein